MCDCLEWYRRDTYVNETAPTVNRGLDRVSWGLANGGLLVMSIILALPMEFRNNFRECHA